MTSDRARLSGPRAAQIADNMKKQEELQQAAIAALGSKRVGIPDSPSVGSFKQPDVPRVHIPMPPKEAFLDEERNRLELERQKLHSQVTQPAVSDAEYEAALRDVRAPTPEQAQLPGFPPNPQPRRTVIPQDITIGRKGEHPLIKALKADFGIVQEADKPYEVKVAGHTWGMVKISPDMSLLAHEVARELADSALSLLTKTEHISTCASIVSLDGVPLWEVLGIEPKAEQLEHGKFLPAPSIRRLQTLRLYDFLNTTLEDSVIDQLTKAYKDKIDTSSLVLGYEAYEPETERRSEWFCEVEGCDHKLFKKKILAVDGTYKPFFCEVHGVPMKEVPSEDLKEALNPLT